jgi:hypothetical protein
MGLRGGRVRKKNQKLWRTWVHLPISGNSWRLIAVVAISVARRGTTLVLRLAAMVLGAIGIRHRALAFSTERRESHRQQQHR